MPFRLITIMLGALFISSSKQITEETTTTATLTIFAAIQLTTHVLYIILASKCIFYLFL